MTTPTKEKLQHALSGAREMLGRKGVEGGISKSRLNQLRGIGATEDTRDGDLLSRTNVSQRPVFDLVANKILGEDENWQPSISLQSSDEGSLAEIASARLASLRERNVAKIGDDEILGESVGLMADGRPIWAEVLDKHRGYSINNPEYGEAKAQFIPEWPPLFKLSTHNTWKTWHVVDENSRASLACEKVVEKPGGRINPLLIMGPSGSGRSHLIHATAQGMLRRRDGNVHFISATTMSNWQSLPNGWQDAIHHANLIAIDDLHLVNPQIATELGMMLDLALNHGVQVIATSQTEMAEWNASRLLDVMRSATMIKLELPSFSSLVTHLRKSATGRSLLLDDHMISRIVSHSDGDWRSVDALFENIALAIEAGEPVHNAEDITGILVGAISPEEVQVKKAQDEELEDLATRIVGEALDHVYTSSDYAGVELHSPLPELNDDWEVPEIQLATEDKLHSKLVDQALIPHIDTTLTVDESEEYLIHNEDEVSGYDKVRVIETTSSLGGISEDLLENFKSSHMDKAMQLASLEEEMLRLAQLSQEADVDDLIGIADRLKIIEDELGKIDSYDEFVPEGDWNLDSDDVEADDLIEKRPILSTINPVRILHPEGEIE